MIFTKADRERAERIESALTSLRLDVGSRVKLAGGGYGLSLHHHQSALAIDIDVLRGFFSEGSVYHSQMTHLLNRADEIHQKFEALRSECISALRKPVPPKKKKKR